MQLKNYETVFILNPVLSEQQTKDAVEKYRQLLTDNGAELVNVEEWGLRKLAYEIAHKSTGSYVLIEYTAPPEIVLTLETEFRRDERVLRFLTTVLDKYALEYNEKRRAGKFRKKKDTAEADTPKEAAK
ncbi:MAG: 30S ribosomal protein S6 [Catalinimonas sp.]